jgi:hypothetical protein
MMTRRARPVWIAAALAVALLLTAEIYMPLVLGREQLSTPTADVIPVIGASEMQSAVIHEALGRFNVRELAAVRSVVLADPRDGVLRGFERSGWTMQQYDRESGCGQAWGWPENWRLLIIVDAPRCTDILTEMVVHELCHLIEYAAAEETQTVPSHLHHAGWRTCFVGHLGYDGITDPHDDGSPVMIPPADRGR